MKLPIVSALLLTFFTLAAANDPGFLTVGRTATPPLLDGQADDAAWRNSVALKPFLLQRENRFAIEGTEARFCYDAENLYVAFQCFERALDPLENRLHEFKADVKVQDSDAIFQDDCVALVLRTPSGCYDFAVNANGALTDSKSKLPDLWNSRDRQWNSAAQVAAIRRQNGTDSFWAVEMRIPFAGLGGAPAPGARWGLAVGRFEKSSKEISSFTPVNDGLHTVNALLELRFADAVPGVTLAATPQFQSGANALNFTVNSGTVQRPLSLTATLAAAAQAPRRFRANAPARSTAAVALPVTVAESGELQFSWRVTDAASFKDMFQSPVYQLNVSSLKLENRLTGGSLQVNGAAVAGAVGLNSGLNTLTVTGANPGGKLKIGDFTLPMDERWQKTATGRSLKLLAETSKLWPNWTIAGVTVNAGGIQQLLFPPAGVKDHILNDYTMNFDLPAGFTIAGASGYYGVWPLELAVRGTVTYGGTPYTRYAVTVKKPVPFKPALSSHEYIAVVLQAPDAPAAATNRFYFSMTAAQAHMVEIPQPIKLKIAPKLTAVPPKKLTVQMWSGWLGTMDDKKLHEQYIRHFAAMGVSETGNLNRRGDRLRAFITIGFERWQINGGAYLATHPEQAQINRHGQKSAQYVCSTAMVNDPEFREFMAAQMPPWHQKWGAAETIVWDYEHHVLDSYLSCFCPRCLTDFAQKSGITAPLTPAIIAQKYLEQWTTYSTVRMAETTRLLRAAIKKTLGEKVRFGIYTGYQSAMTRLVYGVDWTLLDGQIDFAACGYGRTEADLKATAQALPHTPLMLGELVYPYRVAERFAPKFANQATLLRRACDANAGILVYEYATLDGRSFDAISTVSRIMAQNETLFLAGQRAGDKLKLRAFDRADYEWLIHRDRMLIALMNPNPVKRHYEFSAPVPHLTDFFTGQTVSGTVKGVIEPYGVAVFTK